MSEARRNVRSLHSRRAVLVLMLACFGACSDAGNHAPPAEAANAAVSRPTSNEQAGPTNFAVAYQIVRSSKDVATVEPGITAVWVEAAGDETVQALIERDDLGLVRLHLIGATVTDASLSEIARIDSLAHVYILRCPNVTAAGLAKLASLPELRSLSVLQCAGVALTDHQELAKTFSEAVVYRGE